MAKFLTTSGTSSSVEDIVRTANKTLTLVTPYLQINKILEDRLRDADREGVEITIIYGKDKLDYSQEQILDSLVNLELYYYEHLHAKCYYNEKMMVVTSMNLYSFSEKNNREMGILIDGATDKDLYKDVTKEVESIKQSAQPLRVIRKAMIKEFSSHSSQTHNNHVSTVNRTSKETSAHHNGKVLNQQSSREASSNSSNYQVVNVKPELNKNFSEEYNFHHPTLFKSLKAIYPNTKILFQQDDLRSQILILDFPVRDINMVVTGRIDFIFPNEYVANKVKHKWSSKLEDRMPRIRFYWNSEKLNIYTERNFEADISLQGVKTKVAKFIQIIRDTADILKNEAS
jgi:hypothetical protein